MTDNDKKKLNEIKQNVESSIMSNKSNVNRFFKFKKMVFRTSITDNERNLLKNINKPPVEFNICKAPVSRLCGEYSKQEPSINVSSSDGAPVDEETLRVVEGRIRHIMYEANQKNTQYDVYQDCLSGGFSALKYYYDYEHERSFQQEIYLERCDEPTLVGFDPADMSKTKSKSDYYFELVPMPESYFKELYENCDLKDMDFNFLSSTEFSWGYKTGKSKVVILCYYYEKTKKRVKIHQLSNGKVVTDKEYKAMAEEYALGNEIEAFPISQDSRWTTETKIKRYTCCGCKILEKENTPYKQNNIVFVDGDGQKLRNEDGSTFSYFTSPYVYNLAGLQKLTNTAGQTLAADLINMTMHKFIIAEESLPSNDKFLDALTNVQLASTIVYRAYGGTDNQKPNPPPQPVPRVPLPSEVMQTYEGAMPMLQNILGSYDASLGINNNQLSGVAIVEGATQSNAAAMPYVVNQLAALNQVAQGILQLFPYIYKTPRTIPIMNKDGTKEYVEINSAGGVSMNYDHTALSVKVEAGVNFEINKNQSVKQMTAYMESNPQFAKFMGDAGMDIMLDNMSFRGIDVLKERYPKWQQQQAQEQQKAMQSNPDMINAQANMTKAQAAKANVMVKAQSDMADNAVKRSQQAIDKEKADTDRLKQLAEIHDSQADLEATLSRSRAEENKANLEAQSAFAKTVLDAKNQKFDHDMQLAEMAHKVISSNNESREPDES